MLPVNIGLGVLASHVDAETLSDFKFAHITRRCFLLYAYFREKGLNREQCNEIRNRFQTFLNDQLDIEKLITDDKIAANIRVCSNGFMLPPQANATIVNLANSFFNQPELKLAKNLIQCCPSSFVR